MNPRRGFLPGAALLAALLVLAPRGLRAAAPLVLLDPGHGGADPGVTVGDFHEAACVLDLAKRVQALLVARGCDVRLTRDADQSMSLTARVAMANALQPLALVSLHVNEAFQATASGPRVFVPAPVKVDDPQAPLWDAAAGMHAAASRTLGLCLAKALGVRGRRPVETLKLALFRGLSVPGCLVEVGFASDPAELADLERPAYIETLAGELADGIAAYVLPQGASAPVTATAKADTNVPAAHP